MSFSIFLFINWISGMLSTIIGYSNGYDKQKPCFGGYSRELGEVEHTNKWTTYFCGILRERTS